MFHLDPSDHQGDTSLASSIYSDSHAHSTPLPGSPDQIPIVDGAPSTTRGRPISSQACVSTPTRPPLELRTSSFSNSTTSHRRSTTSVHSTRRSSSQQHQWTVFGQLMENEGQMPATGWVLSDHTVRRSQGPSLVQSPVEEPSGDVFAARFRAQSHAPAAASTDVYSDHDTLDEDVSSDESEETETPTMPTRVSHAARWIPSRVPAIPLLWKNMLKCSVAYFIASLFTFHPSLARFFGDLTSYGSGGGSPYPSAHLIATIAVYYNPAKTIGGMFEADSYCLVAWLYSALMSLSGLALFWWLDVKPGFEILADCLLIVWMGLTIWGLTWMKVWMAKPTFNSACSMSATVIFVVVVREGTWETLLVVSSIVLVGTLISNIVCFSLWPQSATYNLQINMTKTLDSFSTLFGMITNTFLLEEPIRKPSNEKMQRAVENHQSSFTSLKKSLAEASSEWVGTLDEQERILSKQAYGDAVDSLTRLAQHLSGLRSGTRLQYELSKAQRDGKLILRRPSENVSHGHASPGPKGKTRYSLTSQTDDLEEALLRAAAEMFGDLVDDVGPPLKGLANACTSCLKRLREAFVNSQDTEQYKMMQPQDFHKIIDGIDRALFTFESTSNHAVLRLYRRSNFASRSMEKSTHSSLEDNSVLKESEHEDIFLVYFFIFTLQEFAGELMSLTDAMRRIYAVELARFSRQNWFKRYFINGPKSFLSCIKSFRRQNPSTKTTRTGLRRISMYFKSDGRHPKVSFPKVRPHALNTLQTPNHSNLTFVERFLRSLWDLADLFKDRNINYAFKVGMSTAVLAAPAFFDATRPLFTEYRGEWALISCFVVMSPTIGATNFLALHRALGTLFGAVVAAGIYTLFPENGIVLSLFGFFFSLPCFYYIVAKPEYATTGRFVLLTYNLTCLYAFNIREDNVPVLDIAWHRSTSVTVGVIWALIASRLWWPSEARRELSKALGEFCLNIGWLYTSLVASNSGLMDYDDDAPIDGAQNGSHVLDESTPLLSKSASAQLSDSIHEFMAMELHLQIKLIELQGLLAQTQHEPRLKGPFPIMLYRSILTSLQTILDKLHSMRCVTTREEWYSVRKDFILPVNKERREMVGNIILYFSTLASAFRLKAPLPPYLPPAEKARERLVDAIRKLDVVKHREVHASRQLLFFAYALTMKGVTQELELLGRTLQDAFGVIGHSGEFDALFAEERGRRSLPWV
ncbi:Fusaric acid resistance protein-like-domain-containing protein [Chiua virens]|nr:Fusaric acid resistance protein-like-domain-containing protein [Chiua virens]